MTSLDISGNKIVVKDSKHLDLFQFLKHSPKLVELNISGTNIPAEIIKSTLDECPNLERLDVSDNNMGDAGLLALIDALKGLLYLDFTYYH